MGDRYYPQTGDYIEATITVRGRVERAEDQSWFKVGDQWSFEDEEVDLGEWRFTKIAPPLPTTPGSLVKRRHDGLRYILVSDDGAPYWVLVNAPLHGRWGTLPPDLFEVIFDAGAAS